MTKEFRILLSATVFWTLLAPAPAETQWLGPHLDAQRWGNLRRHQQKVHRRNVEQKRSGTANDARSDKAGTKDSSATTLSASERQAAWSRHKTEYRKRLIRDGQTSADRWLEQTAVSER